MISSSFFMPVNGKYDAIKRPVLPSGVKPNLYTKYFCQDFILCLFYEVNSILVVILDECTQSLYG